MNRADIRKKILEALDQERDRQESDIWGIQHHSNGKWTMILIEEAGEACAAFLQGRNQDGWTELIQAGAVIIAWLEDREYLKGV